MKIADRLAGARDEQAFASVKRVCYAGLDSFALRAELHRRVAGHVPVDAFALATCDPDTGLIDHCMGQGVPAAARDEFLQRIYPDEVLRTYDDAREGRLVNTSSQSPQLQELLMGAGLEDSLHMTLAAEGSIWGSWCMMRGSGAGRFGERETAFLWSIAPHVARGLKTARLVDAARFRDTLQGLPEAPAEQRAAIVVLDERGRPAMRTANAEPFLDDMADQGFPAATLPSAVSSAWAVLRTRHAAAGAVADASALSVGLRARGRSGRWYNVRASLAEPDATGASHAMVVIDPVTRGELAPILTALYGLTPREREVLCLAAAGESTRKISMKLGISGYTVQDHLDNACEKVGVRGRRALIARIFLDGYAPALQAA